MSMLLAMALAMAGPTKADQKLLGPVKDSPTVQLDPNGAYILLRSPAPVPINLFRIASPQEVEDYRVRRAGALAKAHRKWVGAHKDWVENRETYRAQGINKDEPVEPTEANFAFPAIDEENLIGFGPLFRFAKQKGGNSTYLQRVWPGRYVVYGSVLVGSNGAVTGICVCMGTISFEAKPGEITDVGAVNAVMSDALIWPGMLNKADAADAEKLRSGEMTMMRWTLPSASLPVDPRLSSYKVVPASFKPAGPVPNYFGVQVDRMTAIPGVLAYDRDRIIDAAKTAGGQ
ncbi:MAG TPA: hypothetical protein VFO45_04435 [Sphingomicrobium sp.]|nr:hypothetical protein [Sphingomicrobium sp.]